jgi:hypothetical protein
MKLKVIVLALLINIIFVVSAGAVELPYTYEDLTNDITELSKHENVKVFSIGQSEYGRELYAVKIGKGDLNTVIVGTAHAREWMNSALTIEMAKTYADTYNNYGYLGGYYVRDLLDWCSITFIPMQNPDGVALQQQGLTAFTAEQQEEIKKIGYSGKYKQWQANAKGVDLNRQQNINWDVGRMSESYPSYQNYKGWVPEQALETIALLKHIRAVKPQALISYHSSGQVVDWQECNQDINRDYNLAKRVSDATGYSMGSGSANPIPGGLSPWFRDELGGMALTIETGRYNGENEVRYDDWGDIWEKNQTVGLVVANEVYTNWWSSPEKQAKIDELEQRVRDYKNGLSIDTDKLIENLRLLSKITGRSDIRLLVDKRLFNNEDPVIIRDDYSYISYEDLSKIINIKITFSGSSNGTKGAIIENNKFYIPIRSLKDFYDISWDGESRLLDLKSLEDNSDLSDADSDIRVLEIRF